MSLRRTLISLSLLVMVALLIACSDASPDPGDSPATDGGVADAADTDVSTMDAGNSTTADGGVTEDAGEPPEPCTEHDTGWNHFFGGDHTTSAVRFGSTGDVYIAVSSSNDPDFGTGPLEHYSYSELYLAKYSPDGTLQWVKAFPHSSAGSIFVRGLEVDSEENLVLLAEFGGELDFGGEDRHSGSEALLIAKFSQDGEHIWSESHEGFGRRSMHLSIDGQDGIHIFGNKFPSRAEIEGKSFEEAGMFLLEFSADGAYEGGEFYAGTDALATGVAVDGEGSRWLVGEISEGPFQIGGETLTTPETRFGHEDHPILIKVTDDWTTTVEQVFDQTDRYVDFGGIEAFPDGDIFLFGSVDGEIELGGVTLASDPNVSGSDDFVFKLDSSLNAAYGSTVNWGTIFLAAPGPDRVMIATRSGPSASSFELREVDAEGNVRSIDTFGACCNSPNSPGVNAGVRPSSLDLDCAGNVTFAGAVEQTVDFGFGEHTTPLTFNGEIFLVRLGHSSELFE